MRLYFDRLRYSFRQHGIRIHDFEALKAGNLYGTGPDAFIAQNRGVFKTHRHEKVCWVIGINAAVYFDGLRYSFRQHGIRVHELSKL